VEEITMTDETSIDSLTEIEGTVASGIDRMLGVGAEQVFRDPIRVGDRVVIPAATIAFGGGFGFGGAQQEGGGGGGGGWNDGRPVAVIDCAPEGVRVRPVVDFTRVGIVLIGAALTVWRASRR
jgi:uncharacterized spore protein YtfJ